MYKGKVLDTPGFSKLDLTNLNDIDVKNSFKEFNKFTCPYKNCFHKNESNCRVKESYKNNKILKSRYENYLKILEKR